MKKLRPFFFLIALGLFLTLGNFSHELQQSIRNASMARAFGRKFSAFEFVNSDIAMPEVSFQGPGGKERDFAGYRGTYVLVNLWATWCPPCLEELPSLQDLSDRFRGKGLKVVAISVDAGKTMDDLKVFLDAHDIGPVALYHDNSRQLQRTLMPVSLPVTYLVDRQGNIVFRAEGGIDWMSYDSLKYFRIGLNLR